MDSIKRKIPRYPLVIAVVFDEMKFAHALVPVNGLYEEPITFCAVSISVLGESAVLKEFHFLSTPVLSTFPFNGIHPVKYLDVYSVFTFEPINNLSLDVSRMTNEMASNMSKDEKRFSTSIWNANGENRSFKTIRNWNCGFFTVFFLLLRNVQWV